MNALFRDVADGFDFDQHILGQARYLHTGSGGVMVSEEFSVNLIDRAEMIHVLQEDGVLDNIVYISAGSTNNSQQIC